MANMKLQAQIQKETNKYVGVVTRLLEGATLDELTALKPQLGTVIQPLMEAVKDMELPSVLATTVPNCEKATIKFSGGQFVLWAEGKVLTRRARRRDAVLYAKKKGYNVT